MNLVPFHGSDQAKPHIEGKKNKVPQGDDHPCAEQDRHSSPQAIPETGQVMIRKGSWIAGDAIA
jgi:hypothetical protein